MRGHRRPFGRFAAWPGPALLMVWVFLASGLALAQPLETVTVTTASGAHRFDVEVMRTADDRARGLMHRRFLPPDRGMLFDFQAEQPVVMWMQNTFIPLDMVFIRADGRVHRIEANTEPLSTRTIASGAPVLGVLELNAGTAARIGLRPGDRIEHGMFRGGR